jgi:hypothetical protein
MPYIYTSRGLERNPQPWSSCSWTCMTRKGTFVSADVGAFRGAASRLGK